MGANSAIQWTHHTFNPWRGCSKVHAGCTHCYAETNYSVKMHGVKWGPNGTRVKLSEAGWREPLKWNRDAAAAGERRRVFCASLADVFEDWQGPVLDHNGNTLLKCESCRNPNGSFFYDSVSEYEPLSLMYEHGCGEKMEPLTLDDLRRDLFSLIDQTPMLDWLLLTKRPENVRRMWPTEDDGHGGRLAAAIFSDGDPWNAKPGKLVRRRDNVWIGTSVSDQPTADEWGPRLNEVSELCALTFLSMEPLIGPVTIPPQCLWAGSGVGWVIVGGESGPNARVCSTGWIGDIVKQCKAAGVPVFVKQMGSKPVPGWAMEMAEVFGGGTISGALNDRKGGDMDEWPKSLRVRQMPRETQHA